MKYPKVNMVAGLSTAFLFPVGLGAGGSAAAQTARDPQATRSCRRLTGGQVNDVLGAIAMPTARPVLRQQIEIPVEPASNQSVQAGELECRSYAQSTRVLNRAHHFV